MSFRHTMITQFIYTEAKEDLNDLIIIFAKHLDIVEPHYSKFGRLLYIVAQSRDHDNFRVEDDEMVRLLKAARGCLEIDLDIVVAWEAENATDNRQRVFTIEGRGNMTREEFINGNL